MRERPILPKAVCSFDIETDKRRLLFAGVVVYTLHAGKYFPGRYRTFLAKDLSSLIRFLKEFNGIILGHNIFDFDYRILKDECRIENIWNRWGHTRTENASLPELNMDGIIEKSVDTLWFACRKKGARGGLSLRELVRINIRRAAKGTIGRKIPVYWRRSRRKMVYEYNKNDCLITHRLWWGIVQHRSLFFPIKTNVDICALPSEESRRFFTRMDRRFQVTHSEVQYLTGQRRMFTHRVWAKKLLTGRLLPTNCEAGNYVLTPSW